MKTNFIMMADSYKYGHFKQYPKQMNYMRDYIASRKGEVIFTGLQYYLKEYLSKPITKEMIDEAYEFAKKHGIDFNIDGWNYILKNHNGYLPVRIKALPEGTKVKENVPIIVVESTDNNVAWVVGWVETLLMKIWYPTTITTKSKQVYDVLVKYGDKEWAKFAYHNFGDRSMSSVESASIAGFAHNCVFLGTDNFHSLKFCKDYYNSDISAFSVFATEHSTTTSQAQLVGEIEFVKQMLIENKDAPIVSFVADSYDVFKFTDEVTKIDGDVRKIIESRNQKFVIRPDSGDPIEVLTKMFDIMERNRVFDKKINGKKLSSKYGVLWGDGIDINVIDKILKVFTEKGYAAENFVFGSGTRIGQTGLDRDTYSFAMKCSYIEYEDEKGYSQGLDVFKDPITDKRKSSLKGKVVSVKDKNSGEIICIDERKFDKNRHELIMDVVFENGKILKETTLDEIRKRII